MRTPIKSLFPIALAYVFTAAGFCQFGPGPNPITGTAGAQTLTTGTGTINAGGAISITTNGVALGMTGTSNLINHGTIQTLGTGRAIDSNSGVANLTITNNGSISAVSSDAFRVNTDSTVSLTNNGTIQVTNGGQAIDWAAISTKSNTLTNTGFITAVGDDAVRPGTNGIVINSGTIGATPTGGATPSGSDGIDVRTFTGISITNTGSITGRHGIATDGTNMGPSTITLNNNTGGAITALNGSGLNIDGVSASVTANVINQAGAIIQGGVLQIATEGDGDGIDVDGVLTLHNSGSVLGLGAKGAANNAEALAIGGGTIINDAGAKIVGSTLAADAPNGDPTRAGNGILADDSNGGDAVAATKVTNSGLIQGKSGFAIQTIGTFADTIVNNAGGLIEGGGTGAAILTGGGDDMVTNGGSIVSDTGNAIDLEDGNDTLTIEGGLAGVTGDMSGGDGSDNLIFKIGSGDIFSYHNLITDFEMMDLDTGTVRLDGTNLVASGTALNLGGGSLELANAGPNGETFACLSLSDSSSIDLDGTTSVTFSCLGDIAAGKGLSILDYQSSASPDYAFRLLGNFSSDPNFLALLSHTTINGFTARAMFDGTFTDVTPTDISATPEPATVGLSGLSIAGLTLLLCRCNRRSA